MCFCAVVCVLGQIYNSLTEELAPAPALPNEDGDTCPGGLRGQEALWVDVWDARSVILYSVPELGLKTR